MTDTTIKNPSQTNMAVIRNWVEAINRNDIAAELECWQPDGEFFIVATGTTYRGIDEIQQAGKKSAAVIGGPPVAGRKKITHLSAGADWACVEYDAQATVVGHIQIRDVTLIPAGVQRTLVSKACLVFEMRNGRIRRAREYFDASSMAEQLGLDPATLEKLYTALGAQSE